MPVPRRARTPPARPSQACLPAFPGCRPQAVLALAEEGNRTAVELEELRFLLPSGTLLLEFSLAFSLGDSGCRSTRAVRLGDGTGFGRLQGRPLAEAHPQFLGMCAAAGHQPLRGPDGRWEDGLLLPAIFLAVRLLFPLQLD